MEGLPPSARLLGIGFYICITIVLFTVGGVQLDRAMDTGNLFTLLGLAVGLMLALYGAVRQLQDVLAGINRRNTGRKSQE